MAQEYWRISRQKMFHCSKDTLLWAYGVRLPSAIALCGHTHIPDILYENGIYLVNPGSCSKPRSSKPTYAVIDITDKGIMPVIVEI